MLSGVRGVVIAGSWILTGLTLACSSSSSSPDGSAATGAGGSGNSTGGFGNSTGGTSSSATGGSGTSATGGSGTSATGGSGTSAMGGSTGSSGSGQVSGDCSTCKAQQCNAEGAACTNDSTCENAYQNEQSCVMQHPNDPSLCAETFDETGGPAAVALSSCSKKALDDSAAGVGPCAPACNCVIGSTCGDCIWGACCAQVNSCIQDAGCKQDYYGVALPCIINSGSSMSAAVQCVSDFKAKGGLDGQLGDCLLGAANGACSTKCQ